MTLAAPSGSSESGREADMCRDNEGSMASVRWDKGISSCCRCKGRKRD